MGLWLEGDVGFGEGGVDFEWKAKNCGYRRQPLCARGNLYYDGRNLCINARSGFVLVRDD